MNFTRLMNASAAVVRARFTGRVAPLFITFEVTARCSQRCLYCRVPESATQDEMTTEQAVRLIKALAKTGSVRIGFTGGEPFLRPDLDVLIAEAKAQGQFVSVFSNGIAEGRGDEAFRHLDLLILSLDGGEELNDSIRGRGCFQAVKETAMAAREAGVKVWTNTVVTGWNHDRLAEVLQIGREWGVRCMFQPLFVHPRSPEAQQMGSLVPTPEQVAEAFGFLLREYRRERHIWNSPPYMRSIIRDYGRARRPRCSAGLLTWTVSPEGRLAPCGPLASLQFQTPKFLPDGRLDLTPWKDLSCIYCYCSPMREADLLLRPDPRAWLAMIRRFW